MSPYSYSENVYYLVYSNEVNIKGLQIFSYEIYVYLMVLAFYAYFTFFYRKKIESKIHEISPNLLKSRLCSKQVLLLKLQGTIPEHQLKSIVSFLDDHEKKVKHKSSKLLSYIESFFDHLQTKKDILVLYLFQAFSIDLTHLCVKSLKIMLVLGAYVRVMVVCLLLHLVLVFFILFLVHSLKTQTTNLAKYTKANDFQNIKKYILILSNAPQLFFIFAYIYLILLFSNRFPDYILLNLSVGLFFGYMFLQRQVFFIPRRLNTFIIISNVPILLVLNFSSLVGVSSRTFMFDFLFVFVNVFRISIFAYEVLTKTKNKNLTKLIGKYKTRK